MTSKPATASPSAHETAGPPIVGDIGSFPSHAELARTLIGNGGLAALATVTQSGHPYASRAPFSVLDDGSPAICVSSFAEHTQNLRVDPRASLLVNEGDISGVDPLALARVTLIGSFLPFEPNEQDIARHLTRHPHAKVYIDYEDFSWWRLVVLNARYVGGFGFMGWATSAEYSTACPDPIIPSAAEAIAHLNADHADSCLAIVRVLAGVTGATDAVATSIDRYGITFEASDTTIARVAFPEPLTHAPQVRHAVSQLAWRAHEAHPIDVDSASCDQQPSEPENTQKRNNTNDKP